MQKSSNYSDNLRNNFPITQPQCVIGDYNSSEQSIWPRSWEVSSLLRNRLGQIYNYAVSRSGYFRLFGVIQNCYFTNTLVYFSKWKVHLWNISKKKFIAIKIYVKIPSVLPSILGGSTASTRLVHTYMSVGFLLLH